MLARLALPAVIHFFVHVKSMRLSFPFPPGVNSKQYLHKARIRAGQSHPVASIPFDEKHVIGLARHQRFSFGQLVLVVPSSQTINPTLHPTKLSFHPHHLAQLQKTQRTSQLSTPHLTIPIWPHLISRTALRPLNERKWNDRPVQIPRSYWGTFGSSDGRFGPAYVAGVQEPHLRSHTKRAAPREVVQRTTSTDRIALPEAWPPAADASVEHGRTQSLSPPTCEPTAPCTGVHAEGALAENPHEAGSLQGSTLAADGASYSA